MRAGPAVFGPVASNPTVSRLISTLAAEAPAALSAINTAREQCWQQEGTSAPNHDRDARHPLIIDLDATVVTAHSNNEHATPNWKKGFGFHPLRAFADHQAAGVVDANLRRRRYRTLRGVRRVTDGHGRPFRLARRDAGGRAERPHLRGLGSESGPQTTPPDQLARRRDPANHRG